MNKRKKCKKLTVIFAVFLLCGCGSNTEPDVEEISATGIFSWEEKFLMPESEMVFDYVCKALDCRAVYQEIPAESEMEVVADFLERRKQAGQLVYRLAGARDWGVEEDAGSMMDIIEETARWNKSAEAQGAFTGIVWDVEPYLLESWDEEPETVMSQYVENTVTAYKEAHSKGLSVITCIPYFYDNKGLEEELETLIAKGSDAIAVMNYNKANEAKQIDTEVRLAEKYGKGVIHITELQQPGYHGLTEENTYYYDGTNAVKESWEELRDTFGYQNLGFAWHYLAPAGEILEREEEE